MNKTEALKLALGALELPSMKTQSMLEQRDAAITAVKEALAQPEFLSSNEADIAQLIEERDVREDILDKVLDMVLGIDRSEWSSSYQYIDAVEDVREALAESAQEPLEYWNAVEGWVKIDEVRKHFETVSCGTIYKTAGEGRVPLCISAQHLAKPSPKREWFGLTDEQIIAVAKATKSAEPGAEGYVLPITFARAILAVAAHNIKETT